MKAYTFFYIIFNLIIFQLISLESDLINQVLHVLCALGIITIGIGHGSLDNILYGTDSRKSDGIFIFIYVLLVLGFIGLWAFLPDVAFIFFIIISAYHFGQSQFEEYNFKPPLLSKFLYLFWGGIILLLPVIFNQNELMALNSNYDTLTSASTYLIQYSENIFTGITILFAIIFFALIHLNNLPINDLLTQAYVLLLIIASFKLLPPFIAFSLFFIFIHSLKVIYQEYNFCYKFSKINSKLQFIKLCLPLTLASIAGICIIIGILYFLNATNFIPFALVIILSGITFPHAMVMEKFYAQSK